MATYSLSGCARRGNRSSVTTNSRKEREMQATLERLRQRREELGEEEGGFTLIELLIVIVILGILAAIVVFAVQNLTGSSAVASCQSDFKNVEVAAEAYKAQTTVYPGATLPAGATGTTGTSSDTSADINLLLGTVALSNGTTVGPWLKEAPVNTNHYEITLGTGGVIGVSNSTGTATIPATTPTNTISDCSHVT